MGDARPAHGKFAILASALSFAIGVRHHSLLVRRARWTHAMHSSSFAVCVGFFEHAQQCARSSTHECTRQRHARRALSALDQHQTYAEHTPCIRTAR